MLRTEFEINTEFSFATCFITGVGYYELYINGVRVGNNKLDVGFTTFHKRVLYSTFEVSKLLTEGKNAIGIMMGRGWYFI